jgi:hypothetical protein
VYADNIQKGKQVVFVGLNHNEGAGDGELYAMKNLCSDYYPLLATRARRMKLRQLTKGNGLFVWEKLCWVDGTDFYYDGELKGQVEDSEKSFAAINGYIIIAPDMAYYDIYNDAFGHLEAEAQPGTSGGLPDFVTFKDGTLFGEPAEANTISCDTIDWAEHFKVGDAITITGSRTEANNITAIIREIDGHELRFYENSFTVEQERNASIRFTRKVPELKYMLENENRLWGCTETTIFASKLGDPFNFYVYDGLDTDAFAVDTGSSGVFTGAISYLGYPTFFKERNIYKVYGSIPSNFEVMGSATLGLANGSDRSLAVAGETLFYLSRSGVCMFTGGIPQPINRAFGLERYKNAVAGSDGLKYYISMQDGAGGWHFFVYDTQRGMWHEEDETHATHFAYSDGNLYYLGGDHAIWITGNIQDAPEGAATESAFAWSAEFTDFTDYGKKSDAGTVKKGLSKIEIRLELDEGASCTVKLMLDSSGTWITPQGGTLTEKKKRSNTLAIIPQRADHYRLKLEGTGGCRIYSITREFYQGSELKSSPGRQ